MRIGIYGGTFDPIHLGHIRAAEAAVAALQLDRLLLVPVGIPPHKQVSSMSAAPQQRLEMVSLACEQIQLDTGCPTEASTLELLRRGASYTCDTVTALQKQYPGEELWLLMGTDMFLSFLNWRCPEAIVQRVNLGVFHRYKQSLENLTEQAEKIQRQLGRVRIQAIPLPEVTELSSTQIRGELLQQGKSQGLLPQIQGYIWREHLYGTHLNLKQLTLEQLRPIALSLLKAKRMAHVLGTEQAAAALARRWGENEEEARRAALLHDCAKRLDRKQQLKMAEHYGLPVDEVEREEPGLLHAKNGAALAKELFGINDRIYWAIYWHSTGKENMNRLEKILYLADYIEPSRNFPEVGYLRQETDKGLDYGMVAGLRNTIEDTLRRGKTVHENSRKALEYLEQHSGETT